ncbi:hypothetical protein Tco_0370932 [Tanacetum coccineum]
MKARATLLMALPNKDQLKFHTYQDAKLLMEAIEKRYGGNKESKKVQRTLLKQQYENFAALSSESLDQTFDRLQKLIGQLEIQGEVINQEDMNLKLLRSLPSEWKYHALIWRNKAEIETISLDDLYNNLKIYEPELTGSSNTSQNTQNVAFVSNSTNNTNSTHKADDSSHEISTTQSTTHTHHNGSNTVCLDNLCDAVICAFLASQPNCPQLSQEDLEQLHPDDLEEMDLQWEMAMLTIRARRFIKRTQREIPSYNFHHHFANMILQNDIFNECADSSAKSYDKAAKKLMKTLIKDWNLEDYEVNIKFRGGLLGLKRLHGFLEVTITQGNPQQDLEDQGKARMETVPGKDYIMLPLWMMITISHSQKILLMLDSNLQWMIVEEDIVLLRLMMKCWCKRSDMNNLDACYAVSLIPTTREIHKIIQLNKIIGDLNSSTSKQEDEKIWKSMLAPRNQGNRNGDGPRRNAPVDTSTTHALVVQDGIGYQMGLESLEDRIVVHEKNEAVYEENIAFLKYDVQVKDISIKDLKNQLEEALKEKDDLKPKLEKFEESSKNLTKLINSQIMVHSVFNSRESNVDDSLVNDRFKTGEGFHAVPPPYTRNYMPPRPDLSFAGLDESVFKSAVRKTTTSVPKTETSISKTSKDSVEKPKTVRPSAPIIEE